jgi:hypothetical protein
MPAIVHGPWAELDAERNLAMVTGDYERLVLKSLNAASQASKCC